MISVNADQPGSAVRALHGVSLGPIDRGWALDLSEHYRAAAIPSVRTHDAPIQMNDVVDLHCIFPNPKADPHDPASYVFAPTDDYLAAIRNAGADIYFRFGESIEHQPTKRYVKADIWTPETLAVVAVKVARHYNEGWADGYEWNIRQWEFWCEPEMGYNRGPGVNGATLWEGSADQFFDCYRAVATALKAHDASLQIGLAGFTMAFVGPWLDAAPDDDTVVGGWLKVVLQAVDADVPIDFFSWHIYASEWEPILTTAARVRERLDALGLTSAEQHLTEWAYNPKLVDEDGEFTFMAARRSSGYERFEHAMRVANGPAGAAFAFGALAAMQESSIDLAHHYTGVTHPFGLFSVSGRPHPKFAAFEAFAGFIGDGVRPVSVDVDVHRAGNVAALAAVVPGGGLRIAVASMEPDVGTIRIDLSSESRYLVASARGVGEQWWQPAKAQFDGSIINIDADRPSLFVIDLEDAS